jgi:hypothetical protein
MRKIFLLIAAIFAGIGLNAQTNGSLTFSVTTTSTGNYSPKHVVAIWIEKADGTFIKTKLKRANTRVQWLNQWVTKSGQNVVDAITGSTINAHQTENIVWNATNVNAAVVPDGDYKLWIQMAWANANGPTYSIPFTKGANAVNLNPANQTNFTNMSLVWTPNTTSINEINAVKLFSIYPNPINNQSKINYNLKENSDVTISLIDINGKLVKVLTDENQKAGSYSLQINNDLKSGVYFVKMNTGKAQFTERIVVL